MSHNTSWMEHAACVGHPNPELFFPTKAGKAAHRQAEPALQVCAGCPVVAQCDQFRKETGSVGVWGRRLVALKEGFTPDEMRIRKARCGTIGGYRKHMRLNEPPCYSCRAAKVALSTPMGSQKKRWTA